MKLVDSDMLRAKCIEISEKYENDSNLISKTVVLTLKLIVELIDFFPKVDAVPVVHGYWTWFEEISPSNTEHYEEIEDCGWKCSCCNRTLEDIVGGYWDDIDDAPKLNYCPNCGAKMDGKVEYNERA